MDLTTKEQGGDLGWYRRGAMVPEFDRWMFALAPGQLSPVIETVFGFHIIRVNRRKPAEVERQSHPDSMENRHRRRDRGAPPRRQRPRAWKAGANFDTLVIRFHDPNEEKGSLEPFPRDSLPPSYAAAFAGKKAGDYVDPFPDPRVATPDTPSSSSRRF